MQMTKPWPVLLSCVLLSLSIPSGIAQDKAHLSIDASKAGAKIDRNLFGQFAENLGRGLYGGIWVEPDSSIPINVLQAMILTDKEKTCYVFKMYVPFQDATFIPVDVGNYTHDGVTLPLLDAIAAITAAADKEIVYNGKSVQVKLP
jgi:alpha-L-arabinofuranosidase